MGSTSDNPMRTMMKRRNIVVFMTDQQIGDTQPPFGMKAHMPNLERLHENGVAFTEAYCPSPHCCPSRATFFTGLYPSEHGVWNNVKYSAALHRGLYDGVRVFSEDLKEAGYKLYFSGKWHVSAEEGPKDRGFEVLYEIQQPLDGYHPYGNHPDTKDWDRFEQNPYTATEGLPREPGMIRRVGYPDYVQYGETENPFHDEDVADAATERIKTLGEEPFFLYAGTLGPHDHYFVPERFLDLYPIEEICLPESFDDPMTDKPGLYRRTRDQFARLTKEEQKESLRHYLAFCSYEDYLFGKLLNALEERGLLDDTVVMYVSDHGDYAGAHGLWTKGLPCFREAYHICSTIGFGGVKGGRRYEDALVSLADFAPTFLELAGVESGRRFAGQSLVPFLKGEKPDGWRRELYTQSNGNELLGIQRAVFDDKYKYVFNGFDYDELYDLEHDPHELHNLMDRPEYKGLVRSMCKKMWKFALENQDNIVHMYIMTALAPFGPGLAYEEDGESDEETDVRKEEL